MAGWKEVAIGFESDNIEIDGLNAWHEKWRPVNVDPVKLPHPAHSHQILDYRVYEIGDLHNPVRFAASELSNGVWGFYVPV